MTIPARVPSAETSDCQPRPVGQAVPSEEGTSQVGVEPALAVDVDLPVGLIVGNAVARTVGFAVVGLADVGSGDGSLVGDGGSGSGVRVGDAGAWVGVGALLGSGAAGDGVARVGAGAGAAGPAPPPAPRVAAVEPPTLVRPSCEVAGPVSPVPP